MFVKTGHLVSLINAVNDEAKSNWLFPIAWRHKLAGIYDGFVTNQGLWDRLVFDGARSQVVGTLGGSVRGVVVGGGVFSHKPSILMLIFWDSGTSQRRTTYTS